MPVVKDFGPIKLAVHASDHSPPHYHLMTANYDMSVAIVTGEIIKPSKVSAKMRRETEDARKWASGKEEKGELLETWEKLNARK